MLGCLYVGENECVRHYISIQRMKLVFILCHLFSLHGIKSGGLNPSRVVLEKWH